ncbi:hypothetical protein MAR_022387 [Mya arenaria]|uniref:Uncharacterized protein n=1 Tax=Mya arenaria TaxID=6604 RepID=A0ABY7DN97_MYAAR|nr:hypothetical protein MAR_022387 [Mya arenaria]
MQVEGNASLFACTSSPQRHPSHAGHGPEARWDVWTNWTPCSVNCGTGVTSRTRDCRSMITG